MKRLLLIPVFLLCVITLYAQNNENKEELQTIFDNGIDRISGFGGPFMNFSVTNGEFAHYMGGGGAVLINNKIFLGGIGFGKTTQTLIPESQYAAFGLDPTQKYRLDFGYGGLWGGYIVNWTKAIHPVFSLQFGWGDLSINNTDDFTELNLHSDPVYVITPMAEIEMNITKFMRMSVGANYRIVTDVNTVGYSNQDFSGPAVFLGFKFGWF